MIKANSRTSLLYCKNFYTCYYWSVMYQKENPGKKLKEMNKFHQKYLLLRKTSFPKNIWNNFTQNSPLNVETYFPQSAALFFSQLNYCSKVMVLILVHSIKHYLLVKTIDISTSQRAAICSELPFFPFLMDFHS